MSHTFSFPHCEMNFLLIFNCHPVTNFHIHQFPNHIILWLAENSSSDFPKSTLLLLKFNVWRYSNRIKNTFQFSQTSSLKTYMLHYILLHKIGIYSTGYSLDMQRYLQNKSLKNRNRIYALERVNIDPISNFDSHYQWTNYFPILKILLHLINNCFSKSSAAVFYLLNFFFGVQSFRGVFRTHLKIWRNCLLGR